MTSTTDPAALGEQIKGDLLDRAVMAELQAAGAQAGRDDS